MVYDLQIVKGGFLLLKEWDEELLDFRNTFVPYDEIAFHLYSNVCLAVDITLYDIFLLFSKNVELFTIITGCPFMTELIEDAFSEPVKINNDIGVLQLKRNVIINDNELTHYFDFSGIGENDVYSLEFSPLNEIMDKFVVLNENISFSKIEDDNTILKAKMTFTLSDLVIGIIEELSFMGPPDIKAFALDELNKRAEEENFSFESFEDKLKSWDEKNKIPCKICGDDARNQEFDKPINICSKCFEKIKEN